MKLRIFNKGNGWYVSGSNYKDNTIKAYMTVNFTRGTEPDYSAIFDNPFVFRDIDVLEAKFNAHKTNNGQNVIDMFIFKYNLIEEDNKGLQDVDNFGGKQADSMSSVDIKPDDLPFY